jgi:hypothetical protein
VRSVKKAIVILATAFACTSGIRAQVTCSPDVDKKLCADVAKSLDPIVDHGSPYQGVGIPVDFVTPAEYKKRLSDTKELEEREESFLGGDNAAAKSPDKFSPWYRHTLYCGGYITFFRAKPSSHLVSAILIATWQFEMDSTLSGGRPGPMLILGTPAQTAEFIRGYLYGTMATLYDGSREFGAESEPKNSSNSSPSTKPSSATRQSTTTFRGHTLGESWQTFRRTDRGLCELNKENAEGCSKAAAGEEAMLFQHNEKDHATVTFHFDHGRFDWALANISGPTFTDFSFLKKTYGPPSFEDIHPEKGSATASWRFSDRGEVLAKEIPDPHGGFLISIVIEGASGN